MSSSKNKFTLLSGGGSRERVQGVPPPPLPRDDLRFSKTTGILQKRKKLCGLLVLVEQETSAPPPKKNPGSAPVCSKTRYQMFLLVSVRHFGAHPASDPGGY